MNEAIEIARLGWDVLWGLGTLLALVIGWQIKRWAAPRDELDKVNQRLTRIEERVAHLPTNKSIAEIRESLAQIGAQVGVVSGEMKVTQRLVERINEHLMEGGR